MKPGAPWAVLLFGTLAQGLPPTIKIGEFHLHVKEYNLVLAVVLV